MAESALYPSVAAVAIASTWRNGPLIGTEFHRQTIGLFQTTLNLNYLIFDFGKRSGAIAAAKTTSSVPTSRSMTSIGDSSIRPAPAITFSSTRLDSLKLRVPPLRTHRPFRRMRRLDSRMEWRRSLTSSNRERPRRRQNTIFRPPIALGKAPWGTSLPR